MQRLYKDLALQILSHISMMGITAVKWQTTRKHFVK